MYVKPAQLRTGKTGKEEIEKRKNAEIKLKGSKKISKKAPQNLNEESAKIYKNIIRLLPSDFLTASDTYIVSIVADALYRMQVAQRSLDENGLLDQFGNEGDASKAYERYTKIFDKFSAKLGLSPKDRAQLAVLNVKEEEDRDDELKKALDEDDD